MIFCPNCGEVIPDDSVNCPKCGELLKGIDNDQAVIYASQKKEELTQSITKDKQDEKKNYVIWGVLAVLSLIFLNLNYMSISIDSYFGGSTDTDYTGYYLTKCLEGTARLSGMMVIILIILALTGIGLSVIGSKGVIKNSLLKKIMMFEAYCSAVVTVITFFHIKSLLAEFNSSISTANVGVGCYLNIGIAIISIIVYHKYFASFLCD